jgi:hypothetical protein
MIRRFLLAALVLASTASVPCLADSIPGGERLTLPSKVMGEERTFSYRCPGLTRGARKNTRYST